MPFNDAVTYCTERGGILAEPTDSLQQTALESLADTSTYWWLGATDADYEGNFAWMSGAPWSYTNWNSGEPNDYGSGEDCVHLTYNGKWNDLPCDGNYAKPLCQWKGK